MPHQEILKQLEAGDYLIGFHGSAHKITAFTSAGIGRGGDLNTGLGLFTSEIPGNAAEYAHAAVIKGEGVQGRVYVLAIPCANPFTDIDHDDFYGEDEAGEPFTDKDSFVALRENLVSEGYDMLQFEGDDDVIAVCLEPEKAFLLAELTVDQAIGLEEEGLSLFDGVAILNTLLQKHPDQMVALAQVTSRVVDLDSPSP